MNCVASKVLRIAALLLAITAGTQLLSATTLYVGTCHAGSYSTIQAAINAAPHGATVQRFAHACTQIQRHPEFK